MNQRKFTRTAALFISVLLGAASIAAAQDPQNWADAISPQSAAQTVPSCPPGTMLDPLSDHCASIVNLRPEFPPLPSGSKTGIPDLRELRQKSLAPSTNVPQSVVPQSPQSTATPAAGGTLGPTPGGLGAGITYNQGALEAIDGAVLYTTMFLHPEGLNASNAGLYWLFTTATNRTARGVEVAGSYFNSGERPLASAELAIYDWSCSPDSPCADGGTTSEWVYANAFATLPSCSTTELIDQGGHLQHALRYANSTDRIDSGSPPLWRNSVYLWDFCSARWDVIYTHSYRAEQLDCSLSSACGWWGPIIETFSTDSTSQFPEISEIGFQDSSLVHDAVKSSLPASETGFAEPQQPWILFHSEPNSAYGVGNFVSPQAVVIQAPRANGIVSGDVTIDTQVSPDVEWINIYIDGKYLVSSPPYAFTWDSTGVADGTHLISANAYDRAKRQIGTVSLQVRVENPAAVTLVEPESQTTVRGVVNILSKIRSDVEWENVYIDGKYFASSPPLNFSWNSKSVPDGLHTISLKAYDASGREIGADSSEVRVENGAVSIIAPIDGALMSGTTLIQAVVSSAVSWINFYVDGEYLTSSPPYAYSWNSLVVPDGIHTVSANAYDRNRHQIGTDSVTVKVGNDSGVLIATPFANQQLSGVADIVTTIRADVVWVNVYIDGQYYKSSPPYTFQWDTRTAANGAHRISVLAYGRANARLGGDMVTVDVEN